MPVEAEVFLGLVLFVVVWYVVTDWIERRDRARRRLDAVESVPLRVPVVPRDYPTWVWPVDEGPLQVDVVRLAHSPFGPVTLYGTWDAEGTTFRSRVSGQTWDAA